MSTPLSTQQVPPATRASLQQWASDLLDRINRQGGGAAAAVIFSSDGLLLATAGNLSHDDAEAMAALASAYNGLNRSVDETFHGGGVIQLLLGMGNRELLLVADPTDQGSRLAVLTHDRTRDPREPDIEVISREAGRLTVQIGERMTSPERGHDQR
ncbi:roadblock/LC7 domain-containing protein [Saccharopolyspora endophytica]|uniref:Roadblock/LC7 domain-containing protein n=1 Tax=Saccharopolyspora endophytica TaxID=543886 RepID=A0ABS5DA27_9PSEU|nr:roadblock/LC7 domain-containing protein [Saccharopolyspora endophytica]MBQ0923100.1 roadblock/LC7 domain-containing protein [Saccharopolyspora endophytica]